jgi:hypothetical protein
LKVKRKFTVDAVIVGIDKTSKRWIDGKGIGSAYVAVMKKQPKYGNTYVNIGKVGTTGITDEQRKELTAQVMGPEDENVIPIQQTIERAAGEELTGMENIIFVEPLVVVEVAYEILTPGKSPSFSVYNKAKMGMGHSAKSSIQLGKLLYARRMRSPRIINIRADKNAKKYLDVSHEQGEGAGGFQIGAKPNPAYEHISYPKSFIDKLDTLVLSPRAADKQQIVVPLSKEYCVERSFIGEVNSKNVFQGPIDMWRKLHRLMDRSREMIGFVKDNAIYYGTSHTRHSVGARFHPDVLGCDFIFHTHPYSKLFKTELGFMSPQDLMLMAVYSAAFDVKWHVIAEMYGFECIKTTPKKPIIKEFKRLEAAWKRKDKKKFLLSNLAIHKMLHAHAKLTMGVFNNKTAVRRKLMTHLVKGEYAFTPFDISAATVDELNSKSKYFHYEYYTMPLPLYTVSFKGDGDYPQIEALNNPAFYGYEPKRWIRGSTDSEDQLVTIQDEFPLAYQRAYGFDRPPGDQKMYLFGAQKGGYQSPQKVRIHGKEMYLDATNLPLNFATATGDPRGEGQDAARILPDYDPNYEVPTSWYDIEKGLYNKDIDQLTRDHILQIRVAFDAGRPTETMEPTKFFNKWFENIDTMDEELKGSTKLSKLPKTEKRKLVGALGESIARNPEYVTGTWENMVAQYIETRMEREKENETYPVELQRDIDQQMKTEVQEWEFDALEKARLMGLAEAIHTYTDSEREMIRKTYPPERLSDSLSSAFTPLYGPSLGGEYIEEEEVDDGTEPDDD